MNGQMDTFVKETMEALGSFPQSRRTEALVKVLHCIEEDLFQRRGDAQDLAREMWSRSGERLESARWAPGSMDAIRDDDYHLGASCNEALWRSRRVFPSDGLGQITKRVKGWNCD